MKAVNKILSSRKLVGDVALGSATSETEPTQSYFNMSTGLPSLHKDDKPDIFNAFIHKMSSMPENQAPINPSFVHSMGLPEKSKLKTKPAKDDHIKINNFLHNDLSNLFDTNDFELCENQSNKFIPGDKKKIFPFKKKQTDFTQTLNQPEKHFNKEKADIYNDEIKIYHPESMSRPLEKKTSDMIPHKTSLQIDNLATHTLFSTDINKFELSKCIAPLINNNIKNTPNKGTENVTDLKTTDKISSQEFKKVNTLSDLSQKTSDKMDRYAKVAIDGFQYDIRPQEMTREELEDLFLYFARDISINYPEAWAQMFGILNKAIPYAFESNMSMDDNSRIAINNFGFAINPDKMTRDDLETIFLGFAKEIPYKYPEAWAQLFGILSKALPYAFEPDLSMDDDSRIAINNFEHFINPEVMTREELDTLFHRFAREISVNYPEAWARISGILNKALPNAFEPDLSMDDDSRIAINNFEHFINPEVMTREELETLFHRFAREISVNYPEAWARMSGILNKALPNAFEPDLSMDDDSRIAINNFEQVLNPEIMTRDDLETLFLRFVREVSINYPDAWDQIFGILNKALPNAFEPDLTIDDDTRQLVNDFEFLVKNSDINKKELDSIFSDYIKQVPMQFSAGFSSIEYATSNKFDDADSKDRTRTKIDEEFTLKVKEFIKISDKSKILNNTARDLQKDLKMEIKEDGIQELQQKLEGIQNEKKSLDSLYTNSMLDMTSNSSFTKKIMDDYVHDITVDMDKKDKKELFEIDSKELTNWDMLRTLRRKEVLDAMYEMPQDDLAETLYVVPKHILKKGITQLPVEDMCTVLFNARFPEALLRAMPRKKAIELLPPPKEMLAILMVCQNISGYKTGTDLIEDVVTKGLKVEKEQNDTRSEEEIAPFVEEQLIGKTPRNADALRLVQGKENPIQKALKRITEVSPDLMQTNTKTKPGKQQQKLELKYQKPESLNPIQLQELAQKTIKNFSKEDRQETLAAKRGNPANVLKFLEAMKKVKDLPSAKMASHQLSENEAKVIMGATLTQLKTNHLVKISQMYGNSKQEMVKQMPRYSVVGLVKALPKHFMIQGFKLLNKMMIIGMLKTSNSQTIARVASEIIPRDMVKDIAFKKKGEST